MLYIIIIMERPIIINFSKKMVWVVEIQMEKFALNLGVKTRKMKKNQKTIKTNLKMEH